MKLSELNPAPHNPRIRLQPGSPEYERLKSSLMEFGNVQPIVMNLRTGNIVGGHQKYWILRDDLGELEDDVVVIDIDEEHEKALNIALNKPAGKWDLEMLQITLDNFAPELLGLAQFDRDEAAEMMRMSVIDNATDFLGAEWDASDKVSIGAPELKQDHPHRTGEQMFTMQLVLDSDQRDTLMEAINAAKEMYEISKSMEAITVVCRVFLENRAM